jgi:hypothetical protein
MANEKIHQNYRTERKLTVPDATSSIRSNPGFRHEQPLRGANHGYSCAAKYLRIALVAVGLIFILGVYPLMMNYWPSGWRWSPNQPEYEQMILGIYATLGFFCSAPREIRCSTAR